MGTCTKILVTLPQWFPTLQGTAQEFHAWPWEIQWNGCGCQAHLLLQLDVTAHSAPWTCTCSIFLMGEDHEFRSEK